MKAENTNGPRASWPFPGGRPSAFDWEDPRIPEESSLADELPPRFKVDRKTGAVLDTNQPNFCYFPIEINVSISLSNFRVVQYMGTPRIVGIGEIAFEDDLIGIIGKLGSVSHPISVSVCPASEQGEHSAASLGLNGEVEPDRWCQGSKEEWFAKAFIEDGVLLRTIQAVERTPPREAFVLLSLRKGIYRRLAIVNNSVGSYEHANDVTNYLCPELSSSFNSLRDAEGDMSSISVASQTYVLKSNDESAVLSRLPLDQTAAALDRLKSTIEHIGRYIVALLGALLIGLWFK